VGYTAASMPLSSAALGGYVGLCVSSRLASRRLLMPGHIEPHGTYFGTYRALLFFEGLVRWRDI
jgi:hypothetical protein